MSKKSLKIAIALPKRKRLIFSVALLSILLAAVTSAAFISLWQRTPTLLVQFKSYTAYLVAPPLDFNSRKALVDRTPANAWVIDPANDHSWMLCLVIDVMNQVDNGTLMINCTVPSTLSINVSAVDVYYMQYVYGSIYDAPVFVRNIAWNVPLGSEIAIYKSDVLSTLRLPHDPLQIVFVQIRLAEYQIQPSGDNTSVLVPSTVSLGVSSFT